MQLGLAPPGLIGPVIGLNLWTFVMQGWMFSRRLPALGKSGINVGPEMTPIDMHTRLPAEVRWKAENYNHLHEQPTTFYAVALSLVFLDVNDKWTVRAAWAYTALRIIHSLIQAMGNPIKTRFQVFMMSSIVLFGLASRAAYQLL